jgi:hypothetical protein
MPVDKKLREPIPGRPIKPGFVKPKKKKPTGGMASPGSGRNRKKLTPNQTQSLEWSLDEVGMMLG